MSGHQGMTHKLCDDRRKNSCGKCWENALDFPLTLCWNILGQSAKSQMEIVITLKFICCALSPFLVKKKE